MKQYQQCVLRRGTSETTAWIEKRGAKAGVQVQLLPADEIWTVIEAYGHTLPENLVKLYQQLHRNSLPSVKGMQ